MPRIRDVEPVSVRLRRCRIFAGLGDDALETLSGGVRRRRYERGQVIFHEGDPGDSLHVVASGAVKITLRSPDGEEVIVATLGPGDFFGELALLDEAARSATAEAMAPTETLVLPRSSFQQLLGEPSLRDMVLSRVAAEVRRTDRQLASLRFLDLAGRLAAHLAELAGQIGRRADDGTLELTLPYRQADLAAIVGGSRQGTSRALRELADAGLLVVDRNRLQIPDLQRLARRGET
jgi:CRP/FNR family cyclic AMP-dependent transcriptional regulator